MKQRFKHQYIVAYGPDSPLLKHYEDDGYELVSVTEYGRNTLFAFKKPIEKPKRLPWYKRIFSKKNS